MGKRNRTPGSVSTAVKGPLAPKQAFWKPVARKPGFGVGGIATLSGIGGLVLGAGVPAWAGPDGGVVTHGAAAIQRQGSITTITQSTDRAALSWQSFDIGAGETVQFRQPSTSSIALNTILERKPTEIQGNLTANGQVWLQNPQGVLFGRNATVDVGGLLATTAHVDEAAFAEGRGRIEGAGGQGSIINRGDIAAGEGGVALIAPHVENAGTIAVTGGSAELAAATGFTVDTHGDGLLSVVVDAADAEALSLINEGTITSEGGVVRLTAAQAEGVRDSLVHVGGIVEATGIQEVGGEIVITGGSAEGGVALVTGQVTATKDDQGGAIAVNAAEIRLEQQAVVSVSAPEGGGLVEIGPRAAPMPPVRIAVSADASLTADATATDGVGDAGDILFWSTASTDFKGTASASAFGSGDGGFVDISSAGQLGFDGTVLTSAVSGTPGELLFDPDTIIVGTLTTNDGEIADGVVNAGDGAGVFYISAGALQTRINGNPGGTTTLAAYDSISLNEAFTVGDHTLNLQVGPGDMPSLTLNSTVTMGPYGVLNGNAVEVIFGATGYITFAGANFDTEVNLTASNTLSALNPGGVLGPIIGLPPATFGGDVTLSGTNGVGIYRAITNNNGDTTLAAGPAGPLVVGAPIQSFSPGGDMGGVRLEGDTVTLNAAVSSSQEVTIAATSQVTVNYDVTSSGAFDITIEELASGNTPNVTTTASFTSYTGDVLMPTVGTVSIIGGAMTGANVDITSDSTIEFRPATLDITGNLDLTSNTSTCICGLDGGDYDVDGNVVLDAGDAGSAITVEPLGGGNLPLDVGGDFTIAAGTGDVVVNPESLYVGTQAMGGGTLDIDGAAVTVTSAYVEGGIDIDGPAEITGSSVLLTSIGFYADSLDVDATTTTATVRSDSIYDFSVTGAVDIDGATGALFDAAGSGSVSIGGALTIDTAGGGGDTAAFDNSYSTSVTVGSLSVQAGVGNASIQGPVAIDTSTAASTVTLSGINQITLDGGISATSPDNPLDLSVSSRDVLVNATGGVGVVDEASIDGVFRNITLDANDDAAVAGSGNTLNLTGDLSIMGGASATEGAMLTGYVDAGGAVLLSGFNVQANPATLTVGTTLTLAGQTGASLTGTSYVSGLTTVSAPVGGGSGVDISPTRLDTLGLDVDAAGEINVDITRLESGTDGMLDGNVSLVSTGGAVYAGLGYTFSDVNGDLEISSPLAIDLDPRSLTVDGNLTLSSGTSVSISPFNGDGGVESSFISVGGTFTMQPTAGAGAVPITIDQAGGGAEINIYTVGDVALSSNGGDITIDADVDGDFQESTFGIGGDLTINAGAGSVRMGEFGDPSSLAIAGDLAVTGDDIDVFALIELVDEDGLSPATRSIDMNAGGDFVLALDEIAAGVPGRTGSITLLDAGTIDIDADGAVQIGGDLRGQSGSLTVVSVNAGTDLFTEANATIEGSEVSLTAGGDFAQATVDGSGVGLTIVTNGGAMVTEPALEITADNIEVFGTLNVIGDIELTATDPVLATILIGPQPAGVVTGTSFVQSAAPMGASGIVIATGDVTMNADTVTVDGLVNIAGELTATAPTAITVDDSVTAGLIRLDALDGLITLGAAADLDATDSPTLGVPHPLMMRAADFTIDTGASTDTEATLVGFTDAGESTASIGGTTGIITNDEYEVLGDGTDDLTVVANARDDFTGPTTLIIGDLDAPSGGDTSLSQLSFGASGEIQVTGEISGGGFSDEVRVGGWPIELGTREGVNGDTTNFVPDTIDVSGRIGVIDNGEGFDLEPPDGITFIANDDVITSTGLTDSSLIFFSAGTSVIDIGGDFLQENTTGAASPLDNGVPSAGSDFSALRIDNARRTEIFGTVNGVGGELARFEVEVDEDVILTNLLQINDCVIQAASCLNNRDPSGEDLFDMTDEDTPSDTIPVLDSFDDPDADPLELVSVNGQDVSPGDEIPGPEGGVFIIGANGEIVFDPQDDFNSLMVGESVSFAVEVVVVDDAGGTASSTLNFTVDGVNDAPTAMDADVSTTVELLADPVAIDEVAMDVDMDPLAFSEVNGQAVSPGDTVQLEGGGSITVASDGSLVFSPAGLENVDPDNPTVIRVPVTVTDGNGGFASAEVIVSVTGANRPPTGMAGMLTTNEDMASGALDTTALFDDPEMQDLTLIAVDGQPVSPGDQIAGPDGGLIIVGENGQLFFDPAGAFDLEPGESASFTIDVTVADIFDADATAPVTVTVLGIGGVIALLPGEISTTEDMASDPLAVGTLGGDGVVGDLSVDAVNGQSIGASGGTVELDGGGSLIVGADGSLIFDPGDDFQGLMEGATDMLNVTVTLTDGEGQSGTTPVAIDVSGLNDQPTDGSALLETTEDMASAVIGPDALGMDPDMDILAIAEIGGEPVSPGSSVPLGDGFLVVDGNGDLFFDPAGNFDGLGMDETAMLAVDVTVIDPFGGTATGTLNVTVLGLDGGLIGMDGAISTTEDLPSAPLSPDALANDPDMTDVTIIGLGDGGAGELDLTEGGRLFIDGDGNLVFDPLDDFQTLPAGQNGPQQQVEVTLQDASGEQVTSTVTIDVLGQNDNPIADGEGMLVTDEDTQSPGFATLDVVSDIDQGDMLQVVAVNGTLIGDDGTVELEMGTVTVAPDGTLVFDPAGDFDSLQVGEADMLEVTLGVVDNAGGLGEVTVEIDVTGLNDAPTAVDDGPVESGAFGTTTVAVLDNDFDPENDPLSVINVGESTVGGTVTIGANGELIFNAGSDFIDLGEAELIEFSVEYEITDSQGGFDTAFATFQVSGEGGLSGIDDVQVVLDLINAGILPPEVVTYPTGLIDDSVISEAVVTPDAEIVFGFFNDLGFIVPTLEEEEPVTNRADDEDWPGVQ